MRKLIFAQTLDDALSALSVAIERREAAGEKNLVFCEDRLTLLAEHAVLSRTGGTFLSEVSTFKRFLGKKGEMLSKQGSVMAVSAILSAHEKELKCFRKGAAQAVYETLAQLFASLVDEEKLEESANGAQGLLKTKLQDLSLIAREYGAFLRERGLTDENGYLALLPSEIEKGRLKDTNVFFFAFPSFTAQARLGLRAAMRHAKSVTAILIGGRESFYTNEGARAFARAAKEFGGVSVERAPGLLTGSALELKRAAFSPEAFRKEGTRRENVTAFTREDSESEMNAVCALIRKHVAEDGLRYLDFAVLVPDSGSFLTAEKAMRAHGIPFFSDRKRAFVQHPFCALTLACLRAASDGVSPLAADEIAANYYFGKGENYRNYLMKFGGFRGAVYKEIKDGELLKGYDREELVGCRKKMTGFLALFRERDTGAGYVRAVKELLTLSEAEKLSEELAARLTGAEREFMKLDPLADVLSEIEKVAGGQKFTAREFSALFESGCSALEVSVIPEEADAVFVGDATESRLAAHEVLFVTGLTESLPRVSQDTALITDRDIQSLSEISVEVEPKIAIVNERARESFALNLSSFKRAAYFSRPLRKGDAETAESEAFAYLRKIFALPAVLPAEAELFPYDSTRYAPALLGYIGRKQKYSSGETYERERCNALYELLTEKYGEEKIDAVLCGREKKPVPGAGELYFLRDASPTLLEDYFKCPYLSFMTRALKVKEREERTVLDTDAGAFVHAVLERTAKKFNEIEGEAACRALAEKEGGELLASPRFSALLDTGAGAYTAERLIAEGAAVSVAAYRQLAGSSFRVRETEQKITLPQLAMSGRADRVDEAQGYVRVIDYKTGEIDDSATSYYTGRKLQLQLYLLAASRGEKPAGAFYFPAADNFTKEGESKFRMSGFFSREDCVLSLMDSKREGGKSEFFEGGGRTEKGMNEGEFRDFLHYALHVSEGAEREMRAGNVAPSPYEGVCEYCKCKGACGFTGTARKERTVKCSEISEAVRREEQK